MIDQKRIVDTADLEPNWDAVATLARRMAKLEELAGLNLGELERKAAAEEQAAAAERERAEMAARRARREAKREAQELAAAERVLARRDRRAEHRGEKPAEKPRGFVRDPAFTAPVAEPEEELAEMDLKTGETEEEAEATRSSRGKRSK